MKCLNCGAEIPEGAEKCPECQSPVNMERQEEKAETAAGTEETSAAQTEDGAAAPAEEKASAEENALTEETSPRRPRLLLRLLRKRVQKRRLSLWRRWRLSPWEPLRRCS